MARQSYGSGRSRRAGRRGAYPLGQEVDDGPVGRRLIAFDQSRCTEHESPGIDACDTASTRSAMGQKLQDPGIVHCVDRTHGAAGNGEESTLSGHWESERMALTDSPSGVCAGAIVLPTSIVSKHATVKTLSGPSRSSATISE